ncbi:glycoside hydrolase family 43 protein [Spirochaeta africana]|uniref:Beta-xylosidase n=1 Tax=Spirochaeta africana (strain ATCC 700263 / DSM 8902 / Z-7692) TaxID=889378 RepID=H9UIW6_SPIAZ|nr:glycoside hydrolase family 43 protein [Spirochaeta africana]AFG37459.1 beta-xylosidase [Spirochaeta africana DSM 8902]
MNQIQNPVLKGFHADPAICRVGDTFYIAVSTFEWFPGVLIYRSSNLRDWELAGRPLERVSQLNMAGNPSSGGIWAPCLSYADGRFWLIYTDVKNWAGAPPEYSNGFKDAHNYLVTAETVAGPWSDPIYMNSSGFDPSLFHDDDGRRWFVNMIWDYRPHRNSFAGIVLQEYNHREQKLVGPVQNIFTGSPLKLTEAPHLYKRNGWYYLMTAEGGTSYSHAVTLARSPNIEGPYELHPQTPLLSSVADWQAFRQAETNGGDIIPALCTGIQKAGHGSMAPVSDTVWVLAHLCGRPLPGTLRCPLGRETALQRLVWKDDGWPWPEAAVPQTTVSFPEIGGLPAATEEPPYTWREDFDNAQPAAELQSLRLPLGERADLSINRGWLCLRGAESPESRFRQSLLARRVQHFAWAAETRMRFSPADFQQFAGLVVRYDERTQYILRMHGGDNGQPELGLIVYNDGRIELPLGEQEQPLDSDEVYLGVDVCHADLQFRWSPDGSVWHTIGPVLDASKLSDEYAMPMGFTGAFVGLACFDTSGRKTPAFFDYLAYHETG